MKFLKKAYLTLILIILYAPIIFLVVFSFNEAKSPVWTGFSLDWYKALLEDRNIQSSFYNTLIVAVTSSCLATVLGTFAAIGINKMTGLRKKILMNVTFIPVLSPDIIIGVSLMLLFIALKIPFGLVTLILSHVTFCVPYVILSVMPRLKQMNHNVYEAALDLGATPFYAFRKVILPEIMPGVVGGAFIAFTLSLDDFVVSFFNTAAGVDTLSIQIYSMARRGVNPKINALSTIIFGAIMAILIFVNLNTNQKIKKQAMQEKNS
jgi:spermidine/putrescine transport system permease protein